MKGKIPPDAFDVYLAMGPGRSYQAVASRYSVTKKSVTKRAIRDRWQERIQDIESKARERVTTKAVDTLEEMR